MPITLDTRITLGRSIFAREAENKLTDVESDLRLVEVYAEARDPRLLEPLASASATIRDLRTIVQGM